MKEKRISIRTAILAKKKGFKTNKEPYFYKSNGVLFCTNVKGGISGNYNTFSLCSQSVLQKWLREKHNFHIIIIPSIHENSIEYKIKIISAVVCIIGVKNHNSYEKALEDALFQSLVFV